MSFDAIFEAVQEAALPAIFSKGVALARTKAVILDGVDGGEARLRIYSPGAAVSPRITLWFEEGDWHCDCGTRQDPCHHVTAAVAALKNDWVVKDADVGTAGAVVRVGYVFTSKDNELHFERRLHCPGLDRLLTESLVALAGGVQTGRVQLPASLSAAREDYAVDHALRGHVHGAVKPMTVVALFSALRDINGITLDGAPVSVTDRTNGGAYLLRGDPQRGWVIDQASTAASAAADRIYENGVVLSEGVLRPTDNTTMAAENILAPWRASRGWRVPAVAGEKLLFEVLPQLRQLASVDVTGARLPPVVEAAPRVALTLLRQGERAVLRGRMEYVDAVTGAPLPEGTVFQRREGRERELAQDLRSDWNLSIGDFREISDGDLAQGAAKLARWDARDEQGQPLRLRVEAVNGALKLTWGSRSGGTSVPQLTLSPDAEWFARHGERLSVLLAARGGNRKLAAAHLPELLAMASEEEAHGAFDRKSAELRDRLLGREAPARVDLPVAVTAALRTYQRQGVAWLRYLGDLGLGALLADDMGLGKTLQALCAMEGRTLVVAPTSVLGTWADQARTFRPDLRVHVHHGPTRRLDTGADITVTSYGVLRLEASAFAAAGFDTVVLDEAQNIRNAQSQAAQGAYLLTSIPRRMALTGTPLENRPEDLWGIFRFLNPGLLGDMGAFREEADRQPLATRARMKPFLLRRLKSQVATDLPPKTETIVHCQLGEGERAAYEVVLAAARRDLAEDTGHSAFNVLEKLLRVRQACCHGALVPGASPDAFTMPSAKTEALLERLTPWWRRATALWFSPSGLHFWISSKGS